MVMPNAQGCGVKMKKTKSVIKVELAVLKEHHD
jgi:hypothetical protein